MGYAEQEMAELHGMSLSEWRGDKEEPEKDYFGRPYPQKEFPRQTFPPLFAFNHDEEPLEQEYGHD